MAVTLFLAVSVEGRVAADSERKYQRLEVGWRSFAPRLFPSASVSGVVSAAVADDEWICLEW